MKITNMLVIALVFTAGGIATHATAGPCDEGMSFLNPLTNQVDINGIEFDGGIFDAKIGIVSVNGLLPVQQFETSTTNTINPSNRFNPSTAQVELDCIVFNENTFRATLDVVQEGNETKLQIADVGNVFDVAQIQDWTVDYSNNFPNDPLVLKADGSTILSTFPGTYTTQLDQIFIDLGLSTLNGTVSIGQISGNFSHFGETGSFSAVPTTISQKAMLSNDRFEVEVDWTNATGSGKGDAILATDDSAAFFFFDSSNVDALVRVFDGCSINNRYWVFAGGLTNVAYTITVTDTNTGTVKALNAPAEAPAIADTSAFETCP